MAMGLFPGKRLAIRLGFLACLLGLPCLPSRVLGVHLLEKGSWGLLAGYGFQHRQWAEQTGEAVELSLFYPTANLASWSLGPCSIRLDLQAVLGTRTNGRQGVFAGGGPVVRLSYQAGLSVLPYLHLGAGVSYTDMDLDSMGSRENFFEEAGAGLRCRLHDRLDLAGEYRMMHVSNAGLSERNLGFNSHVVLLGAWYSF